VGDGEGNAHDLLHLEFDGGLGGIDLLLHVVSIIENRGKLASLGETRPKNTRDLLDEGGGGEEVIILLGELLDELLVLVELLQVLDVHLINSELLGALAVLGVTEDANGGVELWHVGKSEGAGETLVSLGIVVLQSDLQLNGLDEFTHLALDLSAFEIDLLSLREFEEIIDGRSQKFAVEFTHFRFISIIKLVYV